MWCGVRSYGGIIGASLALGALLAPLCWGQPVTPWFTDAQMTRLYEGLVAFHRSGIFAPDKLEADSEVLAAYLSRHDPYARLYSPQQYEAFRRSLAQEYGGVEMEISLTPHQTILCTPFPGGAAERAGIRAGDQLLAVDGASDTLGDPLLTGTSIRGPVGSRVTLTVRSSNQPARTVTIVRTATRSRSVTRQRLGEIDTIRLHRFTTETPAELQPLLADRPQNRPLILDLRGNQGGDLESAIATASLFLPPEREIVTLRTTTTTSVRRSDNHSAAPAAGLVLLQDHQTASSAEVFTAALVQNRVAISLGQTSYGKGVAQEFVRLSDGSALLVSFARLLPPNKVAYHEKGLAPTIPVAGDAPPDSAYRDALHSILNHPPTPQRQGVVQ